MTLCPPCSTMNSPPVCEDGNVTVSVPIIASFFSVSWCGTKNCPGPYTSSACKRRDLTRDHSLGIVPDVRSGRCS